MSATTIRKLQSLIPELTATEARIAHFIIAHIDQIPFESGSSLARKVYVSEISVSRFLRRAGYKGIAGLKLELKVEAVNERHLSDDSNNAEWPDIYAEVRANEIRSIERLFEEFKYAPWRDLVQTATLAEQVFVTGFQALRGTAEDFSRRLALARHNVRFLSAHDDMLGEWLSYIGDSQPKPMVLILIDGVPYANDGLKVAQIAKENGMKVIVISDEFCDWAHDVADHTMFAASGSGLFIESTVALTLILNVLVDAVARGSNGNSTLRLDRWQILMRRLNIF
ncbi:MurR/RpiR family transcriptional regulator [Rhizobium alvei]|uniref:MurR/RpiR family transcriptional regulator n=1 Tax=Rhizobium alvei TaxID=1132659 RepID=A0ABT8YSP1_9HYPH|nr:MurR/RpiR family transcriptional regulator [Rhizobium alvei]MDO6966606.1 MurR/RpiR family transcriptional regulator [Rhizobium alvei]